MKTYIVLALVVFSTFHVFAKEFNVNFGCVTNPPDFNKLTYENANCAVELDQLKQLCPEYVTNLVRQLHSSQLSNDNKVLAIYLLGWLRPTNSNAIECLIENIHFKALILDAKTGFRRWGDYPAQEALMKIGRPVVEPIMNHLTQDTNSLRRQLMCLVVKKVAGKEVAVAQIKQKLADESDTTKRANLEAAVKELEK